MRKAGGGCCPLQARYKKRGEGVLSASGPIQKARGGAVHLGPIRKAEGGGGGCCPALQARYKKRGRGRGCLAEEGVLPYMKGGGCNPQTPPPPPRIRLCIPTVLCAVGNKVFMQTQGTTALCDLCALNNACQAEVFESLNQAADELWIKQYIDAQIPVTETYTPMVFDRCFNTCCTM